MSQNEGLRNNLLEFSKTIDKVGIVVGLGMMAFGFIGAGAFLAGSSAATMYIAERMKKKAA